MRWFSLVFNFFPFGVDCFYNTIPLSLPVHSIFSPTAHLNTDLLSILWEQLPSLVHLLF